MAAAAEKVPWKERKDVAFWRGGHTNVQRLVLAGSKVIKASGKADIQLMSWEDDQRGDAFNNKFVSLAEHCRYRCMTYSNSASRSSAPSVNCLLYSSRPSHQHLIIWTHAHFGSPLPSSLPQYIPLILAFIFSPVYPPIDFLFPSQMEKKPVWQGNVGRFSFFD